MNFNYELIPKRARVTSYLAQNRANAVGAGIGLGEARSCLGDRFLNKIVGDFSGWMLVEHGIHEGYFCRRSASLSLRGTILEAPEAGTSWEGYVTDVRRTRPRNRLVNYQRTVPQFGSSALLHLPELLQSFDDVHCTEKKLLSRRFNYHPNNWFQHRWTFHNWNNIGHFSKARQYN